MRELFTIVTALGLSSLLAACGSSTQVDPHAGEPCIFHVDALAAVGGDGSSWDAAFARVQQGIDAAADLASTQRTCEVWVTEGTYYIYESGRDDTVALAPHVEVYGGFAGGEASREERDPRAHVTVLSGLDGPARSACTRS